MVWNLIRSCSIKLDNRNTNSRVGITNGTYSLFVWGQNLNNERYLAYGNPDSSFGRQARIATPRTMGVTLSAKF